MTDKNTERPPRDNLVRALSQSPTLRTTRADGSPAAMPTMIGHFAVFNQWTEINSFWEGEFMERLSPGAFKKTFKENREGMRVLFQHGQDFVVGDKPLGPIADLREDSEGAYYEVPLLDTSYNRDIQPGLEAKLYGASFRFRVMKEELDQKPTVSEYNPRGLPERTIKEVQVMEFGPVTFPAYVGASAGLRSSAVRSLTDAYVLGRMTARDPEKVRAALEEALSARPDREAAEEVDETKTETPEMKDTPEAPRAAPEPEAETAAEAAPDAEADDAPPEAPTTPPEEPVAEPEAVEAEETPEAAEAADDAEPETPVAADALPAAGAEDVPHSDDDGSRGQEPTTAAPTTTETEENRQMPGPVITSTVTTIEERKLREEAIEARFQEIHREFGASALSDEVREEWDLLIVERNSNRVSIADYERRQRELAIMANEPQRHEAVGLADQARINRGTNHRGIPSNVFALEDYRSLATNMDELRLGYQDGARQIIDKAVFAHPRANTDQSRERLERLLQKDDQSGTLAQRFIITGSPTYQRAFGKSIKGSPLTADEQRALSLGSDPDGGFAVPFQLDPSVILTSDGTINPLRSMARVESIIGKEWQGVTSDGITVSRAAEADEASDDSPTFDQPVVRAERVQGFIPFSVELGQDWGSLQSEMAVLLSDAKDVEEATSFTLGNGVGTAAGGIIGTLDAGSIVLTTANDAFAVGDIYKLEEAVPPRFRARAQILANRAIYNKVRQFDTAGGASLWVRLLDGLGNELIGYPARESSSMASTVADATKIMLMGDFKNFLIVDRLGMSVELIPHLFGAGGRPTGQRGIYAIWRNNSVILVDNAFRLLKVT